jgi:hypothetical protein
MKTIGSGKYPQMLCHPELHHQFLISGRAEMAAII